MIKFGPSGNSDQFYAQGYKHTYEAMEWIYRMGLNAYEYSFGHGIRMKEDTAQKIAEEARRYSITISAHAPYYINLTTDTPEKIEKNLMYFRESVRAALWLGATRLVFHPGSCSKMDRSAAFELAAANLFLIIEELEKEFDLSRFTFCPETMGKISQLGSLVEILNLCVLNKKLVPAIDFGHLHARGVGAINTRADFARILDLIEQKLGFERLKNIHIHFSKIEYTTAGEKMHRTFQDEGFGPDFELLAPELACRELEPTVICESRGTMAEDALRMRDAYRKIKSELTGEK